MNKAVYIIDGSRTPFLKVCNRPGLFSVSDLAVAAARPLLTRQPFARTEFDEVIVGCITSSENEANVGRTISLRLGCGNAMPAWTVQRNCGSGIQAIDSAMKGIALSRADLVLAGGTEAMSHAPLILNKKMVNWLADWRETKTVGSKLALIGRLRPDYFKPMALLRGLTDPLCGLIMGQTAEVLASQFKISREAMDRYALRSHQRLAEAQKMGYLSEIVPIYANNGKVYDHDDGVRPDTSLEKLAQLKPIFDRFGEVTAGNSSQITDGATLVIVASEAAVKKYQLPILGRIVDIQWAALPPEVMGLGPVFAATPLLQRNQLKLEDIDYWEINEAFAAAVLACVTAWESNEFCKKHLGLRKALGQLDEERLNIDGGAIAIGHPVGTSGARLVLHLLAILKRKNANRGVAALCIGGGQGGAILLERV